MKIRSEIIKWFENNFDKDTFTLNHQNIDNVTYTNELINQLNTPTNNNKLCVFLYNQHLYHKQEKNSVFIYFTNTKYLQLKGGMNDKQLELAKKIFDPETNQLNTSKYLIYETQYYYYSNMYLSKINETITYISLQRTNGKKIMLIVGSIPEQIDKFKIPDNYVYVFCQDDFSLPGYRDNNFDKLVSMSKYNLLTKTFVEYPIIYSYDIFGLKDFHKMFDLIIFDVGTVHWLSLDKNKLTNIFNYTFDNSSIIVIDNLSGFSVKRKPYDIMIEHNRFPSYYYDTSIFTIICELFIWFKHNFNNDSFMIDYDNYNTPVHDNVLQDQLNTNYNTNDNTDDNNKLNVYLYNKHLYYNQKETTTFIYFTNTKIVL
jgi:hypothetical protein